MKHFLHFSNRAKIAAAITTLALAIPALAAMAKLDAAKSTVTIVFKQMDVPVEASFKKFNAAIDYDSTRPMMSKATVEIDVVSFDLGDAEYNKEVLKKEWFNAAQFPKATFVSSNMTAIANGRLNVSGALTIKGKSVIVSFPMTVRKEGNMQVFEGSLPIKRLAFSVGEGEWKDTDLLANEVTIEFHVVTSQ